MQAQPAFQSGTACSAWSCASICSALSAKRTRGSVPLASCSVNSCKASCHQTWLLHIKQEARALSTSNSKFRWALNKAPRVTSMKIEPVSGPLFCGTARSEILKIYVDAHYIATGRHAHRWLIISSPRCTLKSSERQA